MKKSIILISGRGSNLQSILENIDRKSLYWCRLITQMQWVC